MSVDLQMLTWTVGLTMIMWVPYILAHIGNVGMMRALTYVADDEAPPHWAKRAKRAHYNAIENLVPFAALVLVAHVTGAANEATATAATLYFWIRLAYWLVYVAGVPFGRTLTFAAGWAMQAWILWEILKAGGGAA